MNLLKKFWAEATLIGFTISGIGLLAFGVDSMIDLTPVYLLINFALLVVVLLRHTTKQKLFEAFLIAAVIGFVAEVIGVKTGLIFGDYIYGDVLGLMIFDVPLMLGIMWALVMFSVWSILPARFSWIRIPLAGLVAVAYDITLEHFATRFGLWAWDGSIPFENYVGWFLIGSLIAAVFYLRKFSLPLLPIAWLTLGLHTIFFLAAIAFS